MAIAFNKPLPQYKCHKVVGALKIVRMERVAERSSSHWVLHYEDPNFTPTRVSDEWVNNHRVKEGGYIVQYNDNYVSYSPKDAFEGGYTRLEENASC